MLHPARSHPPTASPPTPCPPADTGTARPGNTPSDRHDDHEPSSSWMSLHNPYVVTRGVVQQGCARDESVDLDSRLPRPRPSVVMNSG